MVPWCPCPPSLSPAPHWSSASTLPLVRGLTLVWPYLSVRGLPGASDSKSPTWPPAGLLGLTVSPTSHALFLAWGVLPTTLPLRQPWQEWGTSAVVWTLWTRVHSSCRPYPHQHSGSGVGSGHVLPKTSTTLPAPSPFYLSFSPC